MSDKKIEILIKLKNQLANLWQCEPVYPIHTLGYLREAEEKLNTRATPTVEEQLKSAKELLNEIARITGLNECDDWDGGMMIDTITKLKATPTVERLEEVLLFAHYKWLEKKTDKTNVIPHYAQAIHKELEQ